MICPDCWAIDEKSLELVGDDGPGVSEGIPYALWTDLNLPDVKVML